MLFEKGERINEICGTLAIRRGGGFDHKKRSRGLIHRPGATRHTPTNNHGREDRVAAKARSADHPGGLAKGGDT